MVLATQNPVDLDYKAMSNAGTWLVGRLQTENDKARVLEGAQGRPPAATDVGTLWTRRSAAFRSARSCSSARRRASPPLFADALGDVVPSRPADEGPDLDADEGRDAPRPASTLRPRRASSWRRDSVAGCDVAPRSRRPSRPASSVTYLDPAAPWAAQVAAVPGGTRLQAFLAARVGVRFDDARAQVDERQEYEALYPLDGGLDPGKCTAVDYDDRDFVRPRRTGRRMCFPPHRSASPRSSAPPNATSLDASWIPRRSSYNGICNSS